MYFDTHAHYTDEAFDTDRDKLLRDVHEWGVEYIVNAGNDYDTSAASLRLANVYPFVYAAVGWHPEDSESFDDETSPALIREWCGNAKVRAVGEIGLDYHYDTPGRDIQRRVFARQMELAEELSLPVVVHDREAHADCMDIVRSFPGVTGEFHCFSGSAEMAAELLKMGWYLGFGGVITFKNARRAIEALRICPMDRILIETDSPYLAPVPNRGKRNDSLNLKYIAEKIAEIKGVTAEQAARQTLKNGRNFFGI